MDFNESLHGLHESLHESFLLEAVVVTSQASMAQLKEWGMKETFAKSSETIFGKTSSLSISQTYVPKGNNPDPKSYQPKSLSSKSHNTPSEEGCRKISPLGTSITDERRL